MKLKKGSSSRIKAKTSEKELDKKKNKVESLETVKKNLECDNRSLQERLGYFRKEFDDRLREKSNTLYHRDAEIKSLKQDTAGWQQAGEW